MRRPPPPEGAGRHNVSEAGVMEQLYFRLQVERGLKDVQEARVISHAKLRNRIAQWRKSAGR